MQTKTRTSASSWFLWFALYSIFGWVFETLVVSFNTGVWADRGFLYGPLLPIYGISALLALVVSKRVKHIVPLFFAGSALVIAVEYITHAALESIFERTWWDYSQHRFHINGRVSLLSVVAFAVMIVLLIKVIHPRINTLTERIANRIKLILVLVLAVLILFDFFITVTHLLST